jgi:L-alanine-DL-glutamate epimerase-like enolase superfamily enzyme
LEQALFSILAQKKKINLTKLFGQRHNSIKIQINISYLNSAQDYQNRFNEILNHQASHCKFKVGRDLALESWAIKKLHSLKPGVHIDIDANQAFTAKQALKFLKSLGSVKLAWAEQLVEKDDLAGWAELRRNTKTLLMADESIHSPAYALLFVQNKWVDFINIKLAKTGGIIEARKIIQIANKHKIKCMLGSMLHGELGLRYNLAFALSQNFISHDFYNYFNLKNSNQRQPLIDSKTLNTTPYVYAK